MSQYQTGTVDVTSGSQVVSGESTNWSGNVSVGDVFKVSGIDASYTVGSVDNDNHITLTSNWAGSTLTYQDYQIVTDFTDNYDIPEIWLGDKDWPWHLTQGLRIIDNTLHAISGEVGGSSDSDAIHDNVSGEINLITEKASPVAADIVVIEDSESSYVKKKSQLDNLVDGAGAVLESDFDATTFLYATSDNTPQPKTPAEVRSILNVEDGADVTDATNVNAAGATMNTDTDISGNSWVLDEDDMASDDATKVPTQQSVKAYVDSTGATDPNAIHDNVSGEISAVTEKASPVSGDLIIIEDSENSNIKKKVQVGNLPTGGGGEANSASNQGVGGVGVFYQKSGIDLQFKNINAGSAKISVTDDTANHEIDIDVVTDITDNSVLRVDGSPNSGEYAKFTGYGLEGRTGSEVKSDLGYLTDLVDDVTPQLGGDLDLNDKEIKLTVVPDSDHTASGIKVTLTNGNAGAVAFGDVCYMASDGDLEFADADSDTTMPARFMALEGISGEAAGEWLVSGIARDDTWNWTVGGDIYVSTSGTTGNTLTQTAPSGTGDQVQIVGFATNADRMMFNPSPVLVEIS